MLFVPHRLQLSQAASPAPLVSMADPSQLTMAGAHASHPDFGHLTLLVFEAVMEVVCVSLPGYIVARQGMFDANAQKFVANLNVQLFTPCLSAFPPILSLRAIVDPLQFSQSLLRSSRLTSLPILPSFRPFSLYKP